MMKKLKKKYYVGITGCTQLDDVGDILGLYNRYGLDIHSKIMPMLGFLVSYKWNKIDVSYPHNKRYPDISELFSMLKSCKGKCFRTIHYNTNEVRFGKEIINLLNYSLSNDWLGLPRRPIHHDPNSKQYGSELDLDIKLGSLIDGIQLNITKPNPCEIAKIKEAFPHLLIILQYNKSFDSTPLEEIGSLIKYRYYDVIDYILLDYSQGQGTQINIIDTKFIYNKINKVILNSNRKILIGFAGGLSDKNIIKKVTNIFVNITIPQFFSIDAESGLRNDNNDLDILKVEDYLKNFMKIYDKLA